MKDHSSTFDSLHIIVSTVCTTGRELGSPRSRKHERRRPFLDRLILFPELFARCVSLHDTSKERCTHSFGCLFRSGHGVKIGGQCRKLRGAIDIVFLSLSPRKLAVYSTASTVMAQICFISLEQPSSSRIPSLVPSLIAIPIPVRSSPIIIPTTTSIIIPSSIILPSPRGR